MLQVQSAGMKRADKWMTKQPDIVGFELSVSARNDGTLEAAYVRFRQGKVSKTKEIIEDVLLADYNSRGRLVGIEILAPVRIADLVRLVDEPTRKPFRRFIEQSAPKKLVA
jgi:uncharacterized protein YuzE